MIDEFGAFFKDPVCKVRSVEAAEEPFAGGDLQLVQDVHPDARSGGGGERHQVGGGVPLPQHEQPLVVRSEVVTPLGDAVSLVDNEPG